MRSGCWRIKTAVLALALYFLQATLCYPIMGMGDIVFNPQAFQQQMTDYYLQVDQYKNQMQQYQVQIQNMQNLGYKNDFSDFYRIHGVMNSATGVSNNFTTMQRQFQTLYPDFATYNNQRGVDYAAQSAQWSQQNQRNAFDMLTLQTRLQESIAQDQANLKYLNSRSDSASGTKDLLQAMNQILIMNTKQLMQLQQILITAYKADAAYMAQQASNEEASRAAGNNLYRGWIEKGNRTPAPRLWDQ